MAARPLTQELSARRSAMLLAELEATALRLFEERGFDQVTVEEIAAAAGISPRTFYRHVPTKEDIFQLTIDRRSDALRAALASRPGDEPPMHSLRLAVEEVLRRENPELVRRWTAVIVATPSVLKSVVGGIHLKSRRVMAQFFAARLGVAEDSLVPSILAAAAGGAIEATQAHWYFCGGDLATTVSHGFLVLERGLGSDPAAWDAERLGGDWP